MKSFVILALSAVALAVPLQKRAEVVYNTVTEQVYETVFTTTTVWVDPTDAPKNTIGAFYEQPPPAATSDAAAPAKSSYAPPPAAAPQAAAPAASPQPAPYVAPAPVASPSPSPQAPANVAPAAPAAPSPAQPATPASGGYSGGGGKGDHTGDMTYYDVEVGTGSCGTTASNSEHVVALSKLDMNNGINPNANPLCGKLINIYSDTGVHQARVFDTCPVCASGALDVPEPLFKLIAPNGDGRVKGVSWSFA